MGWELITSTGQAYRLRDGAIAGRSTSVDIALNDGQASRQHAEFRVQGGQVMVRDLGSTNGTYVNQVPIAAPSTLRPGDQLKIGVTLLTLRWVSDAPALVHAPAMQSEQRQQVVIINQPAPAEPDHLPSQHNETKVVTYHSEADMNAGIKQMEANGWKVTNVQESKEHGASSCLVIILALTVVGLLLLPLLLFSAKKTYTVTFQREVT